jgi:hypothetical protein
MNPATLQLINTILAALIVAVLIGLARWVQGKADKPDLTKLDAVIHTLDAERKAEISKLEVKLDAALLIVGASITRPELAEKMLAMTGRSDDRTQRMMADIVQLFAEAKANAKANAETDKKLDDIPSRVRTLEEKNRS